MTEHLSERDHEKEARSAGLIEIVTQYLEADDAEFLDELDSEDEQLSYVYGKLLENGEDPDMILKEFGVIEEGGEE